MRRDPDSEVANDKNAALRIPIGGDVGDAHRRFPVRGRVVADLSDRPRESLRKPRKWTAKVRQVEVAERLFEFFDIRSGSSGAGLGSVFCCCQARQGSRARSRSSLANRSRVA